MGRVVIFDSVRRNERGDGLELSHIGGVRRRRTRSDIGDLPLSPGCAHRNLTRRILETRKSESDIAALRPANGLRIRAERNAVGGAGGACNTQGNRARSAGFHRGVGAERNGA